LYYAVADNGTKVVRHKRKCPNCGPGIRLAKHHDRLHCGKCGKTYRNIDETEK
jgi:small subunit ribosomal protein S27Ae